MTNLPEYIGPLYFIYIQLLSATPEVHPSTHPERPYQGVLPLFLTHQGGQPLLVLDLILIHLGDHPQMSSFHC